MACIIYEKLADEIACFRGYREFRKSELSRLSDHIFDVPLTVLHPLEAMWPVTILKPDLGSGGLHRIYHQGAQLSGVSEEWVAQPYVKGIHLRVTVAENGFYAVSRNHRCNGRASTWERLLAARRDWCVIKTDALRQRLGIDMVGVDLISDGGKLWLIDANPAPDLAIHGAAR